MKNRAILTACVLALCCVLFSCNSNRAFVEVEGTQFMIKKKPYRYVGTNFWYGAYLGADADYGDRARLIRELDRLKDIGVKNLRVVAASEESDFSLPLSPPFQYKDGHYNEQLLQGLDFLLSEMGKRDMRAVMILNNYWEWTGGMSEYVSWATGKQVPDPTKDDTHTWDDYMKFSARFYELQQAQNRYQKYIDMLANRVNSYTKKPYKNDPTVMTWELANEPRPSTDGDAQNSVELFSTWVDSTASFIHTVAPRQLVTTGSEGEKGTLNSWEYARQVHANQYIDYMTIHMWPKNWGWYKADDPSTLESTKQNSLAYIEEGIKIAKQIDKPVVLEEFGFMRDEEQAGPENTVKDRNSYYRFVFQLIQDSINAGSPLAGSNFWGWGGEGRAQHDDHQWRVGDSIYTADPYSEAQGLNSIYDVDSETLDIISHFAKNIKNGTVKK